MLRNIEPDLKGIPLKLSKNHVFSTLNSNNKMDLQLKHKRALITGGSVGIGLAVAEGLAAEGVNLILCARNIDRQEEEGKRIAETFGVSVDCYQVDVSQAESLQLFIKNSSFIFVIIKFNLF